MCLATAALGSRVVDEAKRRDNVLGEKRRMLQSRLDEGCYTVKDFRLLGM
jgi:hypothetical protein